MKTIFAALTLLVSVSANALEYKELVGTWNIIATSGDSTCAAVVPGAIDANMWLISVAADGVVNVVVQGNTSFPQLEGTVSADNGVLILESAGFSVSSWFKLTGVDSKAMVGLKRVTARNGNKAGVGPCFVEYKLEAKKQ